MKRGTYGSGTIEQRGPNRFRLTFYVNGVRQRQWVSGGRADANRRLRELTAKADAGEHIPASGITLAAWVAEWLTLLGRGDHTVRRRGLVTPRTRERYQELLASYVLPALGRRPIQKLTPTEIDHVYIALERRISATTVVHVHVALRACLASAVRKGVLAKNPADQADPPRRADAEIGCALTVDEVTRLLAGFTGTIYHPIVATAVMTGMRLGEILALRWSDVDLTANKITISRAVERTLAFGAVVKEPKSWRGRRTISIDPTLTGILRTQQERLLRLRAGVSATADVSLAAIRLPAEALVFPATVTRNGRFNFAAIRNYKALTKETRAIFRKLGFTKLRFHDLRATHATALLDAQVPVHAVAQRIGNSPEVLLRKYAKRTRTDDGKTTAVLATLARSLK